MHIAILGANGRTGQQLVRAALAAGHKVVAGVHRNSDLGDHENLTVRMGDTTEREYITQVVRGADCIVSVVGHTRNTQADMQARMVQHLVAVSLPTQHVILLTGTGVRFPEDTPSHIDRLLNMLVARIDPVRVRDGIESVHILTESSLPWTILRVLMLRNGSNERFRLTMHGPAALGTDRAAVAQAILSIATNSTYFRTAPVMGVCT